MTWLQNTVYRCWIEPDLGLRDNTDILNYIIIDYIIKHVFFD
jgi:hypothetical protein